MPDAAIVVARHEGVGERHVCMPRAIFMQLTNQAKGAAWIVAGDVVADGLELGVSGRQDRPIMPCRSPSPDLGFQPVERFLGGLSSARIGIGNASLDHGI
jgi:hypothetical protein